MFPVAVGGIGGSGTRVVAAMLEFLGYYLGDDLNEARDNLWFTLLFKRRSVLVEPQPDFRRALLLFLSRMSGNVAMLDAERASVFQCAAEERLQHSADWLAARADSFCSGNTWKQFGQPWGWKEPNTHVIIDKIFAEVPALRYIHVTRHPLDMAFSRNQNQLENWGPVFLSRNVALTPRWSLSYWCAAHRRVMELARTYPERVMMLDFEAFCRDPDAHLLLIAKFLAVPPSEAARAALSQFVRQPAPEPSFADRDLAQFAAADLAYVRELGYRL
jgi:hypothetical protein